MLHLVERITAKELTTHSLETELKEIIRERDDIVKDRFDHIVEESLVVDINQSITLEEFFRLVADSMSKRLEINADTLYQALIKRERENTTVLNPDLAVPHIVIEGEHKFDILLARCKQGIVFSDKTPKVHSVFVLVGTRDERNFHLRALASIAQIVQEFTFERRWMRAKNKEVLRDIVLLGKRRRQ